MRLGVGLGLTQPVIRLASAPPILDVNNAQKLALTGIVAGQEVSISDAFVLSNDPQGGSGLYCDRGLSGVKHFYRSVNTDEDIVWSAAEAESEVFVWHDSHGTFSNDDVANPWLGIDAGLEHAGYVMTYPALQSFLGGDPADEANWSTIDDVADATARFSLLGIPVGKRVNQLATEGIYPAGEYQYNGPSTNAVAGMLVAGSSEQDGAHTVSGVFTGKSYYNKAGSPNDPLANSIYWVSGAHPGWYLSDSTGGIADHSTNNVATPDLATWAVVSIVINHIAAGANWSMP